MQSVLSVTTRAARRLPLTQRLHRAPQAHIPKTAQSAAKSPVMFSDLVGSTALSARIDPEDLREVISGYQKCVAETVQRFGGFVAKYMGMGRSCISGIRKPMKTTLRGPSAQVWSWWPL